MNLTDDYTATHFVAGVSPIDDIPTHWLSQYLKNFSMGKKEELGVARALIGLSHTKVMELATSRGLL